MKVTYFPGCTLKNKAKDLDFYARECAEILGVTLEEAENWQCCGGVFTTANDEIAKSSQALECSRQHRKMARLLLPFAPLVTTL